MIPRFSFFKKRKLPALRQSEATECGLVCIAMLAQYFGHTTSLRDLRQDFRASFRGSSLRQIMQIAAKMSLDTRPIKLELRSLQEVRTPAILHWNMKHFVVLKKATKNGILIHDPAAGTRFISYENASKHFTGVALEVTPNVSFSPIIGTAGIGPKISNFFSQIHGLSNAFLKTLGISLVLQSLILIAPIFQQVVIDEVIDTSDLAILRMLLIGFSGLLILRIVASVIRSTLILYLGNQLSFQLSTNLIKRLFSLPISFFEKRHLGDILSRLSSIEPLRIAISESAVTAVIDGFMAIFTLVALFAYSTKLAIVVLIGVITQFLATMLFYPRIRKGKEDMIIASANERTQLMESLRGILTVKILGRQTERLLIWRNLNFIFTNANVGLGFAEISLANAKALISGLTALLVFYFAALLIIDPEGEFTIGMLFAFFAYQGLFMTSAEMLFSRLIEFRLLGLHFDRLSDIAMEQPETNSSQMPVGLQQDVSATIQVSDIWFSYSSQDPNILQGLTLNVDDGDYIAIVGSSGCGKSTLIKIMLGLYTPTAGDIQVNNVPLAKYGVERWREKMGVVMQDDRLFSGSIGDNISFFDAEPDSERIEEVAAQVGIHEDICSMQMRYRSLIGDMGSALSGGQKQKILLARALYKKPSVLFFDEGTANLDLQSERDIATIVENLKATRIVVAHRPELVERAEKIYRLEGGILTLTSNYV